MVGDGSLGGDSRADRVPGPLKHREQLIRPTINLDTATVYNRLPKQLSNLSQQRAIPVPQLPHQPRRTLNVREEKRHCASRKHRHFASSINALHTLKTAAREAFFRPRTGSI
jgi:hypothetical protein